MSIGEFELIERFFKRPIERDAVALGIGDDCALLAARPGEQWAVSTDTLIEGVHFLSGVNPDSLGNKALAVNLSDLAACGAEPRCFFLALALPNIDQAWLERFSHAMYALADAHRCVLAGGDTTRSPGPIIITITAMGVVPTGTALTRSGARAGDDIWVSGQLGDAALALAHLRGQVVLSPEEASSLMPRLERPTPRVNLGQRLRGIATSAIDISDGLLGDLRHVLRASSVGAQVDWARCPVSDIVRRQPLPLQHRCALAGGDDYELLFTAPAAQRAAVAGAASDTIVSRIGSVTTGGDLVVLDEHGARVDTDARAFDHFAQA